MMWLFIVWFFPFLLLAKAQCPEGSIPSKSDPTKCYFYETQKMNFMAADQHCVTLGGDLVSIHDMFDNVFIAGESSTFFTDSTSFDFWIGANNIYKPGIWSWIDGTPFDFTDWDVKQSQNITGSNCVAAKIQGAQWISYDCFENKTFVCLVTVPSTNQSITTIVPKPTTTKPKTCETEWTAFGDFCYKVFDPRTWYEAEQICVIDGGHLVSIHSLEEALFVADLAYFLGSDVCDGKNQSWIGLFTDDNFKTFKWTDGTPFDYQKWGTNQPHEAPTEYCNIISLAPICQNVTGAFYTAVCDIWTAKFVCKKRP